MEYELPVVIEQDEDGSFCPMLRGCHTAGDTEEEARELIKDAIRLYVEHLHERGEPILHLEEQDGLSGW